ncbi:MAG: molybdate ABC transporter substrate-binding protein [Pirellulales bacterium]
MLETRQVELLAAIERTRSISAAARSLGISYRHAWLLVQEVNTAAGRTLVESAVGGKRGGGAGLTDYGRAALRLFDQVQTSVRSAAVAALPQALGLPAEPAQCVRLLAAASLQDAVGELLADFTLHKPEIRVRAVFGSSNELAEHVAGGSPADLFLTADPESLRSLEARGWVVGRPRTIGANGLALVVRDDLGDAPRNWREWKDRAGEPTALAEPSSPLGGYTKAWLEPVGIYEQLQAAQLPADNARAVTSLLQSGRARVGVVFASEVRRLSNFRIAATCSAEKLSMSYVAAVLNRGSRPTEAAEFLKFIIGPQGRRALRRAGIDARGK